MNGGVCEEDDGGAVVCHCSAHFHGPRCELTGNLCADQPCADGRVCIPKAQGFICNCSRERPDARCHNEFEECPPNSCPKHLGCKVVQGSIHCDPMPVGTQPAVGFLEIIEIGGCVLGLVLLVAIFVCVRKRYVQQQKKKPACVQDSNGYFPSGLTKSMKTDSGDVELSGLDQDSSLFRSLRPRSVSGVSLSRPQGPVVCSVAPNLPTRPPSTSDTDSIRKARWDMDYEVYPADPDYYGRPTVQEFPTFDIAPKPVPAPFPCDPASSSSSRRNSRFGGFPFPLERSDRRAPLPPCYSNRNLDEFLGPDGVPLPPSEYTAISYYPTNQKLRTHSLDNVSGGYKRMSVRLSVAMPSYGEENAEKATDRERDSGQNRTNEKRAGPKQGAEQSQRTYDVNSMVGSDYGSCEEVMF